MDTVHIINIFTYVGTASPSSSSTSIRSCFSSGDARFAATSYASLQPVSSHASRGDSRGNTDLLMKPYDVKKKTRAPKNDNVRVTNGTSDEFGGTSDSHATIRWNDAKRKPKLVRIELRLEDKRP